MTLATCSICGRNRAIDAEAARRRLQWCPSCTAKVRRGTERETRMNARYLRAFWKAVRRRWPGTWLEMGDGRLVYLGVR